MSRPHLSAEEYKSAGISFIVIFALLAAMLMTRMSIGEILAPHTLLIIGSISLAASLADLFIKYRRLQKGITTEDLLRKVERDIATGQNFVTKSHFRWSMMIAGALGGVVVFLASQLIG